MRRRRFLRAALGALAATPLARLLPKGGEEIRDVTWTVPSSVDVTRDVVAGAPVTYTFPMVDGKIDLNPGISLSDHLYQIELQARENISA